MAPSRPKGVSIPLSTRSPQRSASGDAMLSTSDLFSQVYSNGLNAQNFAGYTNAEHDESKSTQNKAKLHASTPQLPSAVLKFSKDLYEEYERLCLYEQALDTAIERNAQLVRDALKYNSSEVAQMKHSTRKLRMHIFNTYSNQRYRHFELDSLQAKNLLHSGPSSWTLKIQGSLMDREEGATKKFTSFFSRIMIITESETIVWDKRQQDATDVDCLEIHRIGDKEQDILILFFLDYQTPHFSFSKELASIVGFSHGTLPGVIKTLWDYFLKKNMISMDESMLIHCDATISKLFKGRKVVGISEPPALLEGHLHLAKPLCFTHKLRLRGDWIQSANTYDIVVEAGDADLNYSDGSWLPNLKASSLAMTELKHQEYAIGLEMKNMLEKVSMGVSRRNFYMEFSENPIEFMRMLLSGKFPFEGSPFLDESYLHEYAVNDRMASYYTQPWVARAVTRYIENRGVPFDDQISKILTSMSIPDPRKRLREEEDHILGSAVSRRSRTAIESQRIRSQSSGRSRRKTLKDGQGEAKKIVSPIGTCSPK